jgi:glycosyltransferase involved in cell wall biosynthesis
MRLIYVANARIPTEKAHGLQIMKMCEAFALRIADTRGLNAPGNTQINADTRNNLRESAYREARDPRQSAFEGVVLVVPKRKNWIRDDPFSYYGIRIRFPVIYLPVFPLFFGFWPENLSFALSVFFWSLKRRFSRDTIFYGRDPLSLYILTFFGYKVFWEIHDAPRSRLFFWRFITHRFTGVISTNLWKAGFLHKNFEISQEKLFVYPNGFDPVEFDNIPTKEECRRELGLAQRGFVVLYSGSLYDWKGADVLLEAALNFSDKDKVYFVFVGGGGGDVVKFRKKAENQYHIKVVGLRPHSEIPRWLAAADMLILPNSAVSEESRYATSPIKLFEYMASGRPVIASDLPSIREIVSSNEVMLVEPDNPRALQSAIKKLTEDRIFSKTLADNSFGKVQSFTWSKRAEEILKFLKSNA